MDRQIVGADRALRQKAGVAGGGAFGIDQAHAAGRAKLNFVRSIAQ
ncbi:MAG: hypothetical protein IVW56_08835 [Candidatus Binataceae bacterium]|nr:hypothetical protein [Candidatus Binataceae bacterium]